MRMKVRVALGMIALFGAMHCELLEAQNFRVVSNGATVVYPVDTGIGSGSVAINIIEDAGPGFPNNVQGWSMAIAHDPTYVTTTSIVQGSYMLFIDPDFFSPNEMANGFALAAVYSFIGGVICTYEVEKEVAIVNYSTVAGNLIGDTDGEVVALTGTPLGSPPTQNVVIIGGSPFDTVVDVGPITLEPEGTSIVFGRGDCNGDQAMNIADPIFLAGVLFAGGGPIECADACDANDDGNVDIADAVFVPNHLFSGGPPPPPPFGFCGEDPTDDSLDCETSNCP